MHNTKERNSQINSLSLKIYRDNEQYLYIYSDLRYRTIYINLVQSTESNRSLIHFRSGSIIGAFPFLAEEELSLTFIASKEFSKSVRLSA